MCPCVCVGLVAKTNLFYLLLFIHIGIVSHRQPSLAQRDLNLYKLYRLVRENGGMEKVTQELKWQSLYLQMSMPELPNSSYLIKQAYKRYVIYFEYSCFKIIIDGGSLSLSHTHTLSDI